MLGELLAAARALPQLVKVAERIADGVQQLSKEQKEKIAKERLDEKNRIVDDFIDDGVRRDTEVSGGGGDSDETPSGVS
jgi:hypothetical protein